MSDLISGISSGLTTSVIWAALVFIINAIRNQSIENSIRASVSPSQMSFHADRSVGMPIENKTDYPITIRSVRLCGGNHFKHTVEFGMNQSQSPRGTEECKRGWVVLPPKTKATWSFDFRTAKRMGYLQTAKPFTKIAVTAEYTTLFGTSRIIEIASSDSFPASEFEPLLENEDW